MGTHPIFESDFDCLTEMRTTLARAGFNHANRVGFAGYGHKFHADEIVSADKRAFRDLKIYEVTVWIVNQDVSPKGVFMGARRRFCAWRWKYASPIEVQTMVEGKTNTYWGWHCSVLPVHLLGILPVHLLRGRSPSLQEVPLVTNQNPKNKDVFSPLSINLLPLPILNTQTTR